MADVENPAGPNKGDDEFVVAEPSECIGFGNPVPKKDGHGLVVLVAERSKFVRIAAMCMALFFGLALLFISILLLILFDNAYPGTKLAVVAFVAGIIGMAVAWTWLSLVYRILDVEDAQGRGRLIDRFVQFHVDIFKADSLLIDPKFVRGRSEHLCVRVPSRFHLVSFLNCVEFIRHQYQNTYFGPEIYFATLFIYFVDVISSALVDSITLQVLYPSFFCESCTVRRGTCQFSKAVARNQPHPPSQPSDLVLWSFYPRLRQLPSSPSLESTAPKHRQQHDARTLHDEE